MRIKYRYMAEITKAGQVVKKGHIVPVIEYTDGIIMVDSNAVGLHLDDHAIKVRDDIASQCLLASN